MQRPRQEQRKKNIVLWYMVFDTNSVWLRKGESGVENWLKKSGVKDSS